jgi:hypothetical protein
MALQGYANLGASAVLERIQVTSSTGAAWNGGSLKCTVEV